MKVRKDRFRNHPSIIAELNLVAVEDRVTHQLELDDERVGNKQNCADQMNYYRNDPNFERNEARWKELADQVVGEEESEEE